MARNLTPMSDQDKARRFGVERRVSASDINTVTLTEANYQDLFSKTSTESAKYFWGHGARSRNDPNAGYMHIELHETGSGSGASNTALDAATYRFVVYADSEDEVPIVGPTYPEAELAAADEDNRTEKPVLPLLTPGAGKDKSIALQIKAEESAADGTQVNGSQTDDSVSVPFSEHLQ